MATKLKVSHLRSLQDARSDAAHIQGTAQAPRPRTFTGDGVNHNYSYNYRPSPRVATPIGKVGDETYWVVEEGDQQEPTRKYNPRSMVAGLAATNLILDEKRHDLFWQHNRDDIDRLVERKLSARSWSPLPRHQVIASVRSESQKALVPDEANWYTDFFEGYKNRVEKVGQARELRERGLSYGNNNSRYNYVISPRIKTRKLEALAGVLGDRHYHRVNSVRKMGPAYAKVQRSASRDVVRLYQEHNRVANRFPVLMSDIHKQARKRRVAEFQSRHGGYSVPAAARVRNNVGMRRK